HLRIVCLGLSLLLITLPITGAEITKTISPFGRKTADGNTSGGHFDGATNRGDEKGVIKTTRDFYELLAAGTRKEIDKTVTPKHIKNSRDGAITAFSATLSNALSFYRPKYIYEGIESTKQLYIEDFDGLSENENNYLVRTITPSISGTYSIEVTEA